MNTSFASQPRTSVFRRVFETRAVMALALVGLLLAACDSVDSNREAAETLVTDAADSLLSEANKTLGIASIGNVQPEGYVYADQPKTGRYTVGNESTFNAAGGAVQVTRTKVGRYTVRFKNLASRIQGDAHAQVSAVSGGNHQCDSFAPSKSGADVLLNVRCVTANASQTIHDQDAAFAAIIVDEDDDVAFARLSAGFTDRVERTHNPWGRSVEITSSGAGRYQGFFTLENGPLPDGANLQVSGIGCSLSAWNPKANGGTRLTFEVRCTNVFNRPSRGSFHVMAMSRGQRLAYAWAEQMSATSSYAPHPAHAFNPSGGRIAVRRMSTGVYLVAFENLKTRFTDDAIVKVTRHASDDAAQCRPEGWSFGSDGRLSVTVKCHQPVTGQSVDSRFTVLATSN